MSNECMLTTIDNPYNPFTNYNEWFLFDVEKGYNTCSYLGRIAKLTGDMSDKEIDDECERAMDRIITIDPFGIYKKVYENTEIVTDSTEIDSGEVEKDGADA